MSSTTKNTVLFLSLLLVGATLPLAFAPLNLWPLAIIAPAALLWVWQNPKLTPTPLAAFKTGFAFGIGMFGVGVSWVFVSIHRYGNTDAPLAVVLTFIFICVLALFTALPGALLKRFFRGSLPSLWLIGFPSTWVLFECLRSLLLTGFPWLLLGNTQLNTPLAGFAPIGSVYLVSWITLLTSGCVLGLVWGRTNIKALALSLLIGFWGGGALLHQHSWTTSLDKEYTVSLIQGNISPMDKFVQDNPIQVARKVYGGLSQNHWGSDFIIWPENAIAYPLPHAEPYLNELKNSLEHSHSTLITGIQTIINERDYYNTMVALGKDLQLYHKQRLVPFGEFLPFDHLLRGLINFLDIPMSNFIQGPEKQTVFEINHLKVIPMICYEIAFPMFVRNSLKEVAQEAGLIVNISEDGWFGDSWGPHQHLQIAQMRALESGRPIIRATTSGISAVIDEHGHIVSASKQFQPFVLTSTFKAVTGTTPWIHIGLIPLLVLLALGIILPGRLRFKKATIHKIYSRSDYLEKR